MNVPKLRFKEFNDEWKKIQLDSFVDINPKNDSLPEQFIYIDLESVNNGILTTRKIINKSEAPSRAQRTIKENDILYQTVRPYQMNNLFVKNFDSDYPYIASTGYALLRTKENPYFVYSILYQKSFVNKVLDMCTGTSYPAISANDLGTITVGLPSLKEQEKISKTLELLDKKIELQSKKIEALKLFKKGLHDKLFNEATGNDYLLSDIAVFENGKGHENIVDENGKYILINSKFISTEGNVIKKCSEQLTPLFKNDITMVMSDLPNGKALAKCYYIDENNKYSLNQRICKIKVKDDSIINSKYLFYLLNRNSYYLRFDDGVNQTNLKKDDILSLNLVLPSIKEQERDSKTLTIIDNFIEKENNKLSKLFLLKKGLMQSMFV
jgi:type I restriction enzyme S subunit